MCLSDVLVCLCYLFFLPDFQQLCQDDQLVLIKAGFFEVWMARQVRLFNAVDQTVMFPDGSIVGRSELELVFSVSIVTPSLK